MKKKFSLRKAKPSPDQGRKLGSQSNFGKDSDGAKIKKVTEEQLLDDEQRNPPDATTDWLEFTSTGNFRESSSNNNNNNVKGNESDDVLFDESGTDWMDRVIDNDIMGGRLSKESFSVSNRKFNCLGCIQHICYTFRDEFKIPKVAPVMLKKKHVVFVC